MPSTQHARSRLKHTASAPTNQEPLVSEPRVRIRFSPTFSPSKLSAISDRSKKYLKHLPTLAIALLGHWLLYILMSRVRPEQVQNILVPNAYLPVLALFAISQFFLWSYVFLHRRRGLLTAVFCTTSLFLRVSNFAWDWRLIVGLIVFAIIEALVTYVERRVSRERKEIVSARTSQ